MGMDYFIDNGSYFLQNFATKQYIFVNVHQLKLKLELISFQL